MTFLSLILTTSIARAQSGLADLDFGHWEFQIPQSRRGEPKPRVDWSQPPVGCVEDLVPSVPNRPCLDLSAVADPRKDWPAQIPADDLRYWKETKRPLQYCRALEVERREREMPGTFPPGALQLAWMQRLSARNHRGKTRAIYMASREYNVPVHVLTGALYQESLIAEIGISPDGNNYSCGIGQFNVLGWCGWANSVNENLKAKLGWPAEGVKCEVLQRTMVAPFYEFAKVKLGGAPIYKMGPHHFAEIKFEDVVSGFPAASESIQRTRFQAIKSFVDHCSDATYGIRAKALELSDIYRRYIPAGMKEQEILPHGGRAIHRGCRDTGYDQTYPLHTGWLLAVASYNAGPTAVDVMAHYNRWDADRMKRASTFDGFSPAQLVESLFWGGRYNPATDQIEFTTRAGKQMTWTWFRECVVQRHVARIVQHVLLPNVAVPIESLEGLFGCAKSKIDPETGAVIQSGVPPHRQVSSGTK